MSAEKIPGWIERLLLPALNEMKGNFKAINSRIDSLNGRIDGLDGKIDSLRNETKSEFNALNYRFDSLEKSMPVIEEITALKIKIANIESKFADV